MRRVNQGESRCSARAGSTTPASSGPCSTTACCKDGPIELTHGTLDTLDLAVRRVLADIDHLSYLTASGSWLDARRVATEADLEALWWLVVARDAGALQ